ncbi:MAG: cell division ATP-binding protein FtsE [Melioribacteraceae bacterium]|nr:cell division ATP-binding protein FtsE [Melioribacteraceae bacterium]MCF8264944.1 cell division ATP-binding protein FtsE [Melioribacteraceae bacterium]MCF8414386.1 cell division ATP-binding protein FtsE [Melioribacteraceae bacterium]MCF8432559.1 cell division ATP-binding protein FtsE [Melioribacteraceae bacterium]
MIEFNNVYFSYKNQPVLNDATFKVEKGDFSFLIGRSGAGKSTIFQMIYANIFPSEGTVNVGDYITKNIKEKDIPNLRRQVGIIFQDFRILSDRNIYDNLAFILQVTNAKKKVIKKRVFNVLSDVGLVHRQKSFASELSGGEKQRIAIARAIINDPPIIIADEPTGNLDPETTQEILDILIKINKRGTTVLFATHNYDLVERTDGKVFRIKDSKITELNTQSKF